MLRVGRLPSQQRAWPTLAKFELIEMRGCY